MAQDIATKTILQCRLAVHRRVIGGQLLPHPVSYDENDCHDRHGHVEDLKVQIGEKRDRGIGGSVGDTCYKDAPFGAIANPYNEHRKQDMD